MATITGFVLGRRSTPVARPIRLVAAAAATASITPRRAPLPMPSAWSPRRLPDHPGAGWALKAKRVPTLFGMNASGRRAAIAWIAFQPVQ